MPGETNLFTQALLQSGLAVDRVKETCLRALPQQRGVIVVLEAKRMGTVKHAFQEFADKLRFPNYFGGNAAAFDECLADLSWLPADAYILIIADAVRFLDSEPRERVWFLQSLARIAEDWSIPIEDGEAWDRPGRPFHVIFQHHNESPLAAEIRALPKAEESQQDA